MGLQALRTNFPAGLIGNSVDHNRIKVRAFHDYDLIFVSLNDPALSWVDREELQRIAAKLYGPKAKRMKA